MDDSHDITHFVAGLREGDDRAAEVIWREYFSRLIQLARRKLESLPGRAADEEDVVLSAMNSFCCALQRGSFGQIQDREDLWKLLVTITSRKACKQLRREYAEKRGGGHVRGESALMKDWSESGKEPGIADILGKEPTPELACMLAEDCRQMLACLGDERLRTIAQMRLEGYSTAEIADRLQCATRTVERKLERIRAEWSKASTV